MDQLARDAMAARKAGMTYGKYMATKPQPESPERYPKKKKKETAPRCVNCDMLIPPACKSRKYCCSECAEEARRKQDNLRKRKKAEKKEDK